MDLGRGEVGGAGMSRGRGHCHWDVSYEKRINKKRQEIYTEVCEISAFSLPLPEISVCICFLLL